MAEVDREGLDKQDRRYLETLIDVFDGGPTGVEALAATMNLPTDTLSDEIEPYLLREQFIVRTPRPGGHAAGVPGAGQAAEEPPRRRPVAIRVTRKPRDGRPCGHRKSLTAKGALQSERATLRLVPAGSGLRCQYQQIEALVLGKRSVCRNELMPAGDGKGRQVGIHPLLGRCSRAAGEFLPPSF